MSAISLLLALAPIGEGPVVVARLRAENPTGVGVKGAIVRGNLPLPPEYSGTGADIPLALAVGKEPFPTQVTVLTTYPIPDPKNPLGRPEIVELAARTGMPPFPAVSLEVVRLAEPRRHERGSPRLGPAVEKLLASEDPILLRGFDVFGNEYRAAVPLASPPLERFREGPLLETRVHAVTMRPVGAAEPDRPPLPALWRVRAYATFLDGEDFFLLDFFLHNGPVFEDVLGPFYFRELSVGMPAPFGWRVWKRAFGPTGDPVVEEGRTWLPLAPALAGGKMHFVPDQAGFTVRTAVTRPETVERALAFLLDQPIFVPLRGEGLYSWSNPETARYDANKFPLPWLPEGFEEEIRARLDRDSKWVRERPRGDAKIGGFQRGRLGWALPFDSPYGGVAGGGGLSYVYEHETVASGHRRSMDRVLLLMDRVWDRMYRTHFFEDGRPFAASRWPWWMGQRVDSPGGPDPGHEIPPADPHPRRNWLAKGYDAPITTSPLREHLDAVVSKGLQPDYEGALREYMSYDDQHLARAFHMMAAYYLMADPIARDHIVTTGMVVNEVRRRGLPWMERFVEENPGKGVPAGRGEGWGDHARAAAWNVTKDSEVRREIEDALARYYAALESAQSPETGNFARNGATPKAVGGEADWDQCWESGAILADGAKAASEVFRGGPRAEVVRTIERIFEKRGRLSIGAGWNREKGMPYYIFRIGPPGKWDELFVPPVGEGQDNFYVGTPFAWFYEITGDRTFYEKALEATAYGRPFPKERYLREYFAHGMWTYLTYLVEGGRLPARR